MPINNRGLAGQPVLPYIDNRSYAGEDVFLDLTFLDHTLTEFTPTYVSYQIDDITNALNMIPQTVITGSVSGPTYTLQIPGAKMQMSYNWQGSQLCQFTFTAQGTDSVTQASFTVKGVTIIELCSIQYPMGGPSP